MVPQLTGSTKLGWETLTNRRWYRRLSLFFLLAKNQAPLYLRNIRRSLWRTNQSEIPNGSRFKQMFSRTIKFSDSFFPSCIAEWNGLDETLKTATNKKSSQRSLVKIVRPRKSNNFNILNVFDSSWAE